MLEYINNNLSGFWIATGFLLLTVEILLFGFSTIIFLFAGLAAITTGLLMMSGVLDWGIHIIRELLNIIILEVRQLLRICKLFLGGLGDLLFWIHAIVLFVIQILN